MNHTLASRPSSSISIKPASSSLASLTNQIRTFVVALRAGRNQSDKANALLNYLQCSFYQSDKKQVHIMATIVLFFMLATLSHSADAFAAPFLTNNNKVDLISSTSLLLLSNDEISNTELDWQAETPLSSTSTSKQPFQATPITLSIKKDELKEIVNISTIRFNNKLNEMSKNVDATTASKVESLLLEALENYQSHIASHPQDIHPKDMIIPNTISFTNAIAAWARCTRKDSPYRAQELLDKMHSLYSTSGMKHVRPNKISYNSVINAWAKSKEYRSARKAEKLLMRLFEFYEESGGDGELKPDATSFNSVINAVARSREKNCADRARFLLDEMGRLYNQGDTELLPHAVSFGAIINAYANTMEEGASDKAAQLLMHMESLYQLGFENAKPTTFVYNACMNAFAKDPFISGPDSDAADKAEQLLISMEKRYEKEKDGRIKSDCISYSTVINAYANSANAQSGMNADNILKKMISRYLLGDFKCRPNTVAFTATIKAHSATINATMSSLEHTDEADSKKLIEFSARRCEDLLQQLLLLRRDHSNDKSLKPSDVTFDLVLGALNHAGDQDGVQRVQLLREEEVNLAERRPKRSERPKGHRR